MALETPKTKSEIKGNIASLEGRIKNQEDLVKSYEKIISNLNTKITAFQRFINIEKLLKVESDPVKINKLKTEQATLVDKYSILTGKDQAAVEAEIVSIEREKKDRQKDLDKEIAILDEDKLNLRDHKAIEDKRPWTSLSKSSIGKIFGATGIAALSVFTTSKILNVTKSDKDLDKNKIEKTTPKVDTASKTGTKDTTYVMPTPSPSKKDTVYAPEKSKEKVDKEKEKELENLRKKNRDLVNRIKDIPQKNTEVKNGDFTNIDGVKYQKMSQAPDQSEVKPFGDYRKVGGDWYKKVSKNKEVSTGGIIDIDGVKYQKMSQAPDQSEVKPFGDYRKVGGDWYQKAI